MMTVMVLAKFGFNFSEILGSAQSAISSATTKGVASRDVLAPGAQYGGSLTSQINFISLALALVLGTAGLPHVLMRFYTVPTAKEARRSVVWAIALIGAFYLFTLVLGYGAAAIVGPDRILAAAGGQNSAAPLLAFELGGVILLGIISAVAFATILAVVAGLTITASASFAHDVYANVRQERQRSPSRSRCGSPGSPRWCSASSRSGWASWPTARTSRSWWRWRSRSRPRPTCRRSCTRCTGSGSTPAARCGACTAA